MKRLLFLLLLPVAAFGAVTISVDENHTGHFISGVHDPVSAQDAVTKHYADQITVTFNALIFKGSIDCSTNPNYPAANRGWTYIISVAGKIGGASGLDVLPRDLIICLDNSTPSGDQATVGSHWTLVHATAGNTILGPASSTDNDFVQWDGITGVLVKDGGLSLDTDGTLAANSDLKIASQKAVKTYVDAFVPATGNLTDAGTDGLTVTGGTGAVIGSGTSLAQHVADTSHNGYLSSTDWNIFNSGIVTPSALTKTDDTNVTLTLGGTPSSALVNAASLTLGWTGQLAVSRGGTGAATFGAHKFFGNDTGSTAAPGAQDIKEADLILADNTTDDVSTSMHGFAPKSDGNATHFLDGTGGYSTPPGSGTVTSFSSGNLSPLFTTSVATSTTTPALSFTLSTAAAHTFLANNTGSSGAPSYTSFVSGTDYGPATSGSSILYGNGAGGFSNVTIGSNLTFAAGTLSATGGGGSGTVTSVATTSPITGGTITTSGTIALDVSVDHLFTAAQSITLASGGTVARPTALTLGHNEASPGANFGSAILFTAQDSTTTDVSQTSIESGWSIATHATHASYIDFLASTGGGSPARKMRLFGSGGLSLGGTTDPGSGILNASTGFWVGSAVSANKKVMKSDGSKFVASTETYDAPGTANNSLVSDGTNWVSTDVGAWTVKKVSGSDVTRTAQTLANITGLVSDTLTASTLYEFEAVLLVTTSADTTGTEYGIHGAGTGTAATCNAIAQYTTTSTATGSETIKAVDTATATPALTTSASTGTVIIKGWFTSTSTGASSLSIQHLKVTSGTSTVKIGSILKYRKA